ncbi:LacI family DNA-binding transcriptional regulator [Paenibacillus koleovorans]|uniref:LacI family DNA-binding transcriptional regulator n=1 Tax=Paenibacillus koleovorans TaxID=121608 RepID=UPI000FD851B5|nr:LacI family DNA-binding transcriptional regulator [Paenibacillus koleovorans]
MATRKQVAELAGVSEAVVSYVLHNKSIVKEETKRKVLEAIEQLGYRPNLMARGLKMRQTRQIAVLVGYMGNPFEAGILLHVEKTVQELGYAVFFHSYNSGTEERLKELLHGRVDGILLLGQSLHEETIAHFAAQGVPIFSLLQPTVGHEQVEWLDVDWHASMWQLASYLKEQGHVRVALMTHRSERSYLSLRAQAFLVAAAGTGLQCEPEWILYGQGQFEPAQAAMLAAIVSLRGEELPYTALVGMNDLMAMGAMSACRHSFVSVPQQLAVVSCEGILLSSEVAPPLTTLLYPREQLGQEGTTYFIRKLMNGAEADRTWPETKLQMDLVVRQSG